MLRDLSQDERALADYMSELSELAFHAGWMDNLEHALWRAVEVGPSRYGHLDLTTMHIDKLKQLSASCGGWVCFDSATEETFVPMQQWRRIYESEHTQ
jgi:hypothetical protein